MPEVVEASLFRAASDASLPAFLAACLRVSATRYAKTSEARLDRFAHARAPEDVMLGISRAVRLCAFSESRQSARRNVIQRN